MKTCMVVDDSRVIRKVARHILESYDFSVIEACDGSEALALTSERQPDVILLDWNMPVMGGLEFLKAYRAVGGPAKVIFCTTENDIGHIEMAIHAGADEYVMKPFDSETIFGKLQIVGCA